MTTKKPKLGPVEKAFEKVVQMSLPILDAQMPEDHDGAVFNYLTEVEFRGKKLPVMVAVVLNVFEMADNEVDFTEPSILPN